MAIIFGRREFHFYMFPILTGIGQLIGRIASVRAITVQDVQDEYRNLIRKYV